MPTSRSSRRLLVLTAFLGLAFAGCATGDVVMIATTYDGQKVRVPLSRNGPDMTNEDGVQIVVATFIVSPEKKLVYRFAFTDSRNRPLKNVRIEDVSDTGPVALVEDAQPAAAPNGAWKAEAPPLELTDPRLGWIATIQNSLRVYRFTLTFSDGKTLTLLQGSFIPAAMKAALRNVAGMKY